MAYDAQTISDFCTDTVSGIPHNILAQTPRRVLASDSLLCTK